MFASFFLLLVYFFFHCLPLNLKSHNERFPFTKKKIRKFWLGLNLDVKGNMTFWFVPLEIFGNKQNS